MAEEEFIQKFYKHTNDASRIGWKTCYDKEVIGPNLQQVFTVLKNLGLGERAKMYQKEGWSGDLYAVHRRLFQFQNETVRFMGDSGIGGSLLAQIYDVTLESTGGWAQYLSLVLKGFIKEEVEAQLSELDFAPKHSYLANNDPVPGVSSKRGLWLDNIVEFPVLVSPFDLAKSVIPYKADINL